MCGTTPAGCSLAARYLLAVSSTAHGHEVDPVAVRKSLALLTKLVSADGLAALQLVGLLLSAPFLVVSTAFLTMPEEAVPRARGGGAALRLRLPPRHHVQRGGHRVRT